MRLLATYPQIGTPTNGERRVFPLSSFPYSIIYRAIDHEVRVLVLRHHHRDPEHGEDRL